MKRSCKDWYQQYQCLLRVEKMTLRIWIDKPGGMCAVEEDVPRLGDGGFVEF